MSNAAKHRKKAAEFEQLKQIDRAIASYVRAIEESEADGEDVDVALLNKVGDLALRQGRVPDAVTYYERAVEHYATAGLFNNAIALCNKILRNAPGRSNVYFTLGRICAKKGLRGDATRNFLDYAARMQQEGRVEEAMRALAEVADLMPELTEVRRLVDEHAVRAGIAPPRRRTPIATEAVVAPESTGYKSDKSSDLIFLEVDYGAARVRATPPIGAESVATSPAPVSAPVAPPTAASLPFIDLDTPTVPLERFSPAPVGDFEPTGDMRGAAPSDEGAVAQLPELESVGGAEAAPAPDAIVESIAQATDSVQAHSTDAPELLAGLEPVEFSSLQEGSGASLLDSEDDALDANIGGPLDATVAPLMQVAFEETTEATDLESAAPVPAREPEPSPGDAPEPLSEHATDQASDQVQELLALPEVPDLALAEAAYDAFDLTALDQLPPSPVALDLIDEVGAVEPSADLLMFDDLVPLDEPVSLDVLDVLDVLDESAPSEEPVSLDDVMPVALEVPPMTPPAPITAITPLTPSTPIVPITVLTPARAARVTPSLSPALSATLDAALEAGAEAVARAAADSAAQSRRPPFRLDPHDFILPGELPPLVVGDDLVTDGLRRAASPTPADVAVTGERSPSDDVVELPESDGAVDSATPTVPPESELLPEPAPAAGFEAESPSEPLVREPDAPVTDAFTGSTLAPEAQVATGVATDLPTDVDAVLQAAIYADARSIGALDGVAADVSEGPEIHGPEIDSARGNDTLIDDTDIGGSLPDDSVLADTVIADEDIAGADIADADMGGADVGASAFAPPDDPERTAVRLTPALPIAAVAAEANAVARSRRDELRAAVAAAPQDWSLRRRLAEALFEAGQRDAGLSELEASLNGFVQSGEIESAADVSEMLVGVSPERVPYHQKRVELAVRLKDQQRLRFAYLDLADTLVRTGEESRAQAVYVRVLEIDPLDDRARAALGSAAPPPPAPAPPAAPEEGFVNLADWLREDTGPASTRMRMREPVVSGDEDADFAALLRHFKDGVARSLGEEDFESRYDLGVAYKEMGLLDDAIAEFQKALRSRTHRLPAYEALGQCFVEQGRYQVAATVLSRALHEPGLSDEQRVGVLYLLAYSCEALQRWGEARSYFQRVYATDINFRDVAARLAALEQLAS